MKSCHLKPINIRVSIKKLTNQKKTPKKPNKTWLQVGFLGFFKFFIF